MSWASRCRLEPSSASARPLPSTFLAYSTASNPANTTGRVEAMNRALQEARAGARGYRRVDNFIAMAYLVAGKLTHLPAPPVAPFRPLPHETT
ncbi:MAG: transposase [Candidatus Accumulibacter sp.]|nr:transposase [Accumulibacter sp.]